ncbi:MAG: GntR family transcriptional regulator [Pseudomonadota bacterium]
MPLPKYHQVYLVLKERVLEGHFDGGLPGELDLMARFEVSRVTVRKALELLAAEGLIAREPGRGTRVIQPRSRAAKPAPREGVATQRTGLLANLVSMSLDTKVQVISVDNVQASEAVAQALHIAPASLVQKAVRLRSTRQGPLSHITTYVPAELTASFGRKELGKKPILVLLEESGLQLGQAVQQISARLADAGIARLLDVPVGSALLHVRRVVHDQNDRPIQCLHGLYRPDRYEYQMKLSRVGEIDARVWVSSELQANFN